MLSLSVKHRLAANVVKTALLGVGASGRSICVQTSSWSASHGDYDKHSVFVAAPDGTDIEPFYETGKSIVEAVRKTVASIKGANAAKSDDQSELAPF